MTRNLCSSIEEVVCKITTKDNGEVINEQDAPIRKCAAREIPIEETRKDSHVFLFMQFRKVMLLLSTVQIKRCKNVKISRFC